jgi:MFS family permease
VAIGVAVACAAHFLIGVDGVAVAIVLPTLQDDLGVAPIDAQWVLTAYGLAFGGTLLLGGRLGDLYGRRRLLMVGMVAFAAGSLVAGAAPALGVLIAARAVQGLGAALAVPAALALIGSMFPPGPARTRALSLLGAMAAVGIMSGMLMGGVVTDVLGWRWVFLLMVPPALVAAVAAPRVLPEARAEERAAPLDVAGALLITVAFVTLLFGVTRVEHSGAGAPVTVVPLAAGLGLLGAFVAYERRVAVPLVRFEILRTCSAPSDTAPCRPAWRWCPSMWSPSSWRWALAAWWPAARRGPCWRARSPAPRLRCCGWPEPRCRRATRAM